MTTKSYLREFGDSMQVFMLGFVSATMVVTSMWVWFIAPQKVDTAQPGLQSAVEKGSDLDRLIHDVTRPDPPGRTCWQMPLSAWYVADCRGPGIDCWCSLMPMHSESWSHVDGRYGSKDLFLCQPLKNGSGFK